MMKINNLINLADTLDEQGLEKEASIIDDFLKTAVKTPMHKCGIKEESVEMHKRLLEGYQKASDFYDKEYKKVVKSSNEVDSPNMGKLREILRGKAHNCNAVCLHEMYFADVVDSKPYPLERSEKAQEALKALYEGGSKAFERELLRAALTARNGWVMLNYCTTDGKLYLDICDLHEIGIIATSIPVLVLDMWEHAYINDFGLDKEAYVNWFLSRLDWRNIVKRIQNCQRMRVNV